MSRFIISLFAVTAVITQVYSQTMWTKDTLNPVLPKGSSGEWDSNIVENPYVLFDGAVYHMWYAGSDGNTALRIGYAHSSDGIIWTKDTLNNPVLPLGPSGSWDEGHVLQPSVIFDGTSYHMWYCGTNNDLTIRNIGYATSPDRINWTKNGNPVVEPGPPGSWDDVWVDSPNILFINGIYHMWYCGFDGTYVQTGHATSLDGLTWAKDPDPVLEVGPPGSWDEFWVYQPSVIFDGDRYHMWYSGGASAFAWRIGYAYSFDGTNWTKYDDPTTMTPPYAESDTVLSTGPSGCWEDTYVGQSSVIFNNDSTKFKMWYGGGTGFGMGAIGYASAPLKGNVINVPTDLPTIQAGIDSATNGDTVLVQPGTYVENINFNGKIIVVGSWFITTGDTSFISQTVIDGSQPSNSDSGSVVYFVSGEDSNSVLSGFKITGGTGTVILGGGNTTQTHGGGIFLDNSSSPILSNLIVSGNVAESANGAGIRSWNNSNPIIENVTVIGNDGSGNAETNDGSGGISLENSSPILKNVKILNNIGLMSGGMMCANNSNPVLINVTISGNNASGSAWWNDVAELVSAGSSNPVLVNTILWNDTSREILLRLNSAVTVAYSDIQGGRDSIASFDNDTTYWLDGNTDLDPLFVNANNGDYRLQEGSPCIDAGVQDTFIVTSGLNYIYIPPISYLGNAPDMGAYEFDPPSGMNETWEFINGYELFQNYPNPFNPTTNIEFSILNSEFVTLKVYNILGEEVATLVSERLAAGNYNYDWDASGLASGVYLYRIQTQDYVEAKKMILMK